MALHQYDYIFAVTTLFAFLDAWNIGANDVANSFASSVSSRSLSLKQAMLVAACMEFAGSVAVGSRVAETVREKIIDPHLYDSEPPVLMLTMMCAIIGSSTFLTLATRFGFPVSTTHSIIGGLVGAGTASVGIENIRWGWHGVAQVFAAWGIAPGISGVLGAAMFLVTKQVVLSSRYAVHRALFSIPVYSFVAVGGLTMLVVWKGIQLDVELNSVQVAVTVIATATGFTILQVVFLLPYLWRRIMNEDWQLKWHDIWHGPYLLSRPLPSPPPPGRNSLNIKDYYRGHLTQEELKCLRASEHLLQSVQAGHGNSDPERLEGSTTTLVEGVPPRPPGSWNTWPVFWWRLQRILYHGLEQDVIKAQQRQTILTWDIQDMHARAARFDNRAEHIYSSLQVLTAATASFVHGANDVANAIAPYATTYLVWRSGRIDDEVPVPVWVLCFGGGAIVLGLMTYGYHLMRNLGNRLTLMSPSRGFCMELSSALTILLATRLRLPVSTTQCIAGASIGVGLANGDWRCINLRLVGWIYFGWVLTVPVTALISGMLMGLILNAPRWTVE
ncbi:inorganic phosphate transporter [Aspergillus lucknowensis]|uniref:Phosphate transporter n=1 Tax=Aspergillus lucknowensis TaxID=176173 RepID=A0ABR4LJY6_9EURO